MFEIEKVVKCAIEMEIAAETEMVIKEAVDKIQKRIPAIIAAVSIKVSERMTMERIGPSLCISVRVAE